MKVTKTKLDGVIIIEPKKFYDERGFFLETFKSDFYRCLGLPEFVQANHSRSTKGVLRGLHYQLEHPQGKLVRVARGSVLDVAVDVRVGSPTFGQWESCVLDDISNKQFYIPTGFAHGFFVTSDIADFEYMCSDYYHPGSEQGILWNDEELAINWGDVSDVILSEKDKKAVSLSKQTVNNLPQFIT